MICYNHIERAGGTTFNWIFRHNYPLGYLALQPFPNAFTGYELRWLVRLLPWTKCLGGHNIRQYRFYESAINRPINYVTFLRDPIHRFLSHYQYQVSVMNKKWTVDEFIKEPKFKNFMTYRIAGSYDVEKAKDELVNRYAFVGITDRFDESLILMKAILGLKGFDLRYVRQNAARRAPINDDPSLKSPEIISRMKDQNLLDEQLYRFTLDELWPRYLSVINGDLSQKVKQHQFSCQSFKFPFFRKWIWRAYRQLITNPLRLFFYYRSASKFENLKKTLA